MKSSQGLASIAFLYSLLSLTVIQINSNSLSSSCSTEVTYDSKTALTFKNNQNESTNTPCNITIKTGQILQTSFLVKFEMDQCQDTDYTLNIFNGDSSVLIDKQKLCSTENSKFLLINASSSFLVNIIADKSNKSTDIDAKISFKSIKAISITSFNYVNQNNSCSNINESKCAQPSNICINKELIEQSCQIMDNSNSTSQTTTFTTKIPDEGKSASTGHKLSFLIFLLIVLTAITAVLIGVWVYGRRKRKWREFLAQYDNNTDWEYEQLEDGPAMSGVTSTRSPVFNMNVSNDEITTYSYSMNSAIQNSKKGPDKITERTHIID